MEINGKQALVTGGANGIGLMCVKSFIKNKARRVFILDNCIDHINKCSELLSYEISQFKVVVYHCDVSNVKDFEKTFYNIVDDYGRIDIVINNAGIFNETQWENVIKTNFIGTTSCMLLAMKHMEDYRHNEDGVIINVSSISALKPIYGCPVYSATKSAIVSMGRSFSEPYYAKKCGIRVMNICPSLTYTGMANNLMDKFSSRSTRDEWYKSIKNIYIMSDTRVAEEITKMIQIGKNGDTWICENDEPSQKITFHVSKSKL